MARVVSATSRAPARRCTSGASSARNAPSVRRDVRRVGVALTARLEGVLLRPLDALPQLCCSLAQVVQFGVAPTDGSGAEIIPQTTTHLGGSADSKPLLEALVFVTARGPEQTPQSQPHVVQ